jgi:Fe-S-cluster containining protein
MKANMSELPLVPDHWIKKADYFFNIFLNLPSADLLIKLHWLYEFIDYFSRDFVSTFTTCVKNCSGDSQCCFMDVQMTYYEAEYIFHATGIAPKFHIPFTTGNTKPCPFLCDDRSCFVYQYRPLVCRTYHVLTDPIKCKTKEVISMYGCGKDMGNIIFKSALHWIHYQNITVLYSKFGDVRDFFPDRPTGVNPAPSS